MNRSPGPRSAVLLGWSGAAPFAALAGAAVAGQDLGPWSALDALRLYGTIILAFMGGAQWGAATVRDARGWRPYGISVAPALWAFALAAAPLVWGLIGLAAGFAGLLAYDLWCVRRGEVPSWYGRLRVGLTATVCLCLLIAAAVAR